MRNTIYFDDIKRTWLKEENSKTEQSFLGHRKMNAYGFYEFKETKIKKVIFNDPATIVLWSDNTKTVVKCMEGDTFSQEIGLAMAICKKALGDDYHKTFNTWVDYEPE